VVFCSFDLDSLIIGQIFSFLSLTTLPRPKKKKKPPQQSPPVVAFPPDWQISLLLLQEKTYIPEVITVVSVQKPMAGVESDLASLPFSETERTTAHGGDLHSGTGTDEATTPRCCPAPLWRRLCCRGDAEPASPTTGDAAAKAPGGRKSSSTKSDNGDGTASTVLSLSLVIGIVIGTALAAVAVIAFVSVYTTSLRSLEQTGTSFMTALTFTARIRFATQVNATMSALELLQELVASDMHPSWRWTLPDDFDPAQSRRAASETWHTQWLEVVHATLSKAMAAAGYVVVRLADGSVITGTRQPFDFPTYLHAMRTTIDPVTGFEVNSDVYGYGGLPGGGANFAPSSIMNTEPFPVGSAFRKLARVNSAAWNLTMTVAATMNNSLAQLNAYNASIGIPAISYAGTSQFMINQGQGGGSVAAAPKSNRGAFSGVVFTTRLAPDGSILIPGLRQIVSLPLFNASGFIVGAAFLGIANGPVSGRPRDVCVRLRGLHAVGVRQRNLLFNRGSDV
jgi:hypothetical protein